NSTPTGHMYLGLALAHLSKDAEAEKELKAAIDSSNNQLALAHYYLGGVYWQMATSLQVPSEKQQKYNHAADELEAYLRLALNSQDADHVRSTIKQLRSRAASLNR